MPLPHGHDTFDLPCSNKLGFDPTLYAKNPEQFSALTGMAEDIEWLEDIEKEGHR